MRKIIRLHYKVNAWILSKKNGCKKKIVLDLSKAFDTLNSDRLLYKLRYYGVHGTSLALIKSYLTNRCQCNQFDNSDRVLLEIVTGIPQGSNLGPMFFSIFIND